MKSPFHCWISLLALLIGSALAQAATVEPEWSKEFDKTIEWQKISDAGYLILGTKEALFGLDPATGETAWSLEQFKKMPDDFLEMIPNTQFGVITYKGGAFGFGTTTYIVNMISGEILWDTSQIELGNCFGQYYLPQAGGLLIFGMDKKGHHMVKLVDLAEGSVFWETSEWYKPGKTPAMFSISDEKKLRMAVMGNQEPTFTPDGNFLEMMSTMGLRKISTETGEIMWTADIKFKQVPAPRWGYAPMTLSEDGSVIYVPYDRYVYAVSTEDGRVLWEKPDKLKGMAYQMEATEAGLVVRGGPGGRKGKGKPFITVIDYASGEESWKKPFKDLDNASSFVIDGDRIVLYADREIHSIEIGDGTDHEIADKIKFKDKEIPHTLSAMNDGYLLQSSQNLMFFDRKGNEKWHTYNKAPQANLLAKVASTAVIMAVNVGSAANAYSRASAQASQSVSGRGSASYSLITSNPVMSERFSQTQESANFVYMLSVVGKGSHKSGAGVVQVDKRTGENAKSVVLGTKKPNYEVDEVGQRLFFLDGKKELKCFKF